MTQSTIKGMAALATAAFLLGAPSALAMQTQQECRAWCFAQCSALHPGDIPAIQTCFDACDAANCYT